jgi:hypothetical protein
MLLVVATSTYDPVKYDMFLNVLEGLKALGLAGHDKGQGRYFKTAFGASQLPGRASRIWATPKLLGLAKSLGIHEANSADHFKPEPPRNPLVLRDKATRQGNIKKRGKIIRDYKRTPHTERLEADVRELNKFLDGCDIRGGVHEGYTRNFNLRRWTKAVG